MQKRLLFIYNPRAGKAQIRSHLLDIIDIFTKAEYEVTAYPTQKTGDALKAVKEKDLQTYDLIVCSGGDGTLDEVVTGIMQCRIKIPIGFVPAGSTNDFAKSLGIPKNMKLAAHNIVKGGFFASDIGLFNEDIFVYIAAFGLFTEVSYETKQDVKNVLGHMAYILEGIKRLSAIKAYRLHVISEEIDAEEDFIYGMVTNSVSVGGFKNITGKYVQLDDGLFEVTLIKRPTTAMELNMVIAALLNRNISAECMYCFKTSELTIESGEEVAWTLDGEYGGLHSRVEIKNDKQVLKIKGVDLGLKLSIDENLS